MANKVIIGVDVGGTNTDAVVIAKKDAKDQLLSSGKELTTPDITTGVRKAIYNVLKKAHDDRGKLQVVQVNIGTTHFINAMVQGKGLTKVSVIRLCGTASTALPPFSDFPSDLREIIKGTVHLCNGGFKIDGSLIEKINREQIEKVIKEIKEHNIKNIVVAGIFSPIDKKHQQEVRDIIKQIYSQASVTLSYKLGNIGMLERQNAAILNQCIRPLSVKTIDGFREALASINIKAELYLTQNDGSILEAERVLKYPIYSFASGATNSMRGAMFLCKEKNAIVLDIGGTTTDVGVLKDGFPRQASTQVKLARVKTNFRMPDVVSIGLGGGSYINNYQQNLQEISIGPLSAGYNLKNESFIFKKPNQTNQRFLTTSDIAVAAGFLNLGNKQNVSQLPKQLVKKANEKIIQMIQNSIQMVKLSDEQLPVIFVGGGACLIGPKRQFKGVSKVYVPQQSGVANAIGAALSQVSASFDRVVFLQSESDQQEFQKIKKQLKQKHEEMQQKDLQRQWEKIRGEILQKKREKALKQVIIEATNIVKQMGADQSTIEVRENRYTTLGYMPGQKAIRIEVKTIGNLKWEQKESNLWQPETIDPKNLQEKQFQYHKQTTGSKGQTLANKCIQLNMEPGKPYIDQKSGQWILSEWDVQAIAIGAGIFGCGGGGNTHLGRIRTLDDIRKGKKIRIITYQNLYKTMDPERDKVCPIAYYGAPLAIYEQLVTRDQMNNTLKCFNDLFKIGGYQNGDLKYKQNIQIKQQSEGIKYIENYQPTNQPHPNNKTQNIVGILICQIGGLNALEPFVVASDLGLPVVDCDGMGRAFPQLGMFSPYMHGVKPYPVTMADHKGTRVVILEAKTGKSVENHLRETVVGMGCQACVALNPLNKHQIESTTIHYSVSRAWYLGDAILRARLNKQSPISAIVSTQTSKILIIGKIKDVKRETQGGYNRGHILIEGVENFIGKDVKVLFQNQFIIVRQFINNKEGIELATVPDLISIVDADSAEPVPTEQVKYGMRICIVVIAAPDNLKTQQALMHVGPQAFGYKGVQYKPIGKANKIKPIPSL